VDDAGCWDRVLNLIGHQKQQVTDNNGQTFEF
jgi:hypothetical protein